MFGRPRDRVKYPPVRKTLSGSFLCRSAPKKVQEQARHDKRHPSPASLGSALSSDTPRL